MPAIIPSGKLKHRQNSGHNNLDGDVSSTAWGANHQETTINESKPSQWRQFIVYLDKSAPGTEQPVKALGGCRRVGPKTPDILHDGPA